MRLIIGLVVGLLAGYAAAEAFAKRNEAPTLTWDGPIPPPPPTAPSP